MRTTTKARRATQSEAISLRISTRQRAIIDRGAEAVGKTRSDFMLEAAVAAAESALLDQRYFVVDQKTFAKFKEMIDKPPRENERLRRLLSRKAPWDQ